MSEVKNPILEYADQYRAEAARGQKLADIWSVVTDLERNIAPLWDTQRLRADTAERGLANCKLALDAQTHNYGTANLRLIAAERRANTAEAAHHEVLGRWNDCAHKKESAERKLAAAEQRIAELIEFLKTMSMPIVDDEKFCIERVLVFDNAYSYLPALNPNPEAESHD